MRKLFIVLLVAIVAAVPTFANDNQIGISIAPEWMFISQLGGSETPSGTGSTQFYLTADGANYFGNKDAFGVEYGLGVAFPINSFQNGTTMKAEGDPGFAFRVGAGYRHEFSSLLGLFAGLGINGTYTTTTQRAGGYSASASTFILGMYGRIGVDVTLIDCLRINAGLSIGGPLMYTMSVSAMGMSQTETYGVLGVTVAPFVGVAYVY